MKIAIGLATCIVFGVSLAQAQVMVAQPQVSQTVQQAQATQQAQSAQDMPTADTAEQIAAPRLQAAVLDEQAEAVRRLERENKKLRAENSRLQEENAALSARVDNFSKLGGSEVHAYCPNSDISRNTAGVESDCTRSGYKCEAVSGLCRSTCQTTDMCAAGFVCDTGIEQCVVPGGGD